MAEIEHVLVINDYGFVNGGISRVALDSAKALADRGIEVTFFSAVGESSQETDGGLRRVSLGQTEFLAERSKFKGLLRAYWNREAKRAVAELVDSLDPRRSIVHVHSWAQANSASIFAPLLRKKARFVVTLHDYFVACPNGAFTVFPQARTCRARPLSLACLSTNCDARSRLHKLFKVGRTWVQSRVAGIPAEARNYIFVTPFIRRILDPHLPPEARRFLLPNPIDLAKGSPVEVGKNAGWAFVGRLSPDKGPRLFAEAAARLNLEALFLGEGEEAEAIRAIYPDARMLGWLERADLLATLGRCRGLVCPSIYLESQSLAVTEALALGLPVVVASDTAAAELVVDGRTGLIFRKNDPVDLAEKIARLDGDAKLRAEIGREAFERYWSDPPTLERHIEGLMEIYRAIE